jgi:excisionase family DNA binding protein
VETPVGKLALTPAQAAEAIGVHVQTLRRLIDEGRLRAVKAGRRTLVPVRELERFLAEDAAASANSK